MKNSTTGFTNELVTIRNPEAQQNFHNSALGSTQN